MCYVHILAQGPWNLDDEKTVQTILWNCPFTIYHIIFLFSTSFVCIFFYSHPLSMSTNLFSTCLFVHKPVSNLLMLLFENSPPHPFVLSQSAPNSFFSHWNVWPISNCTLLIFYPPWMCKPRSFLPLSISVSLSMYFTDLFNLSCCTAAILSSFSSFSICNCNLSSFYLCLVHSFLFFSVPHSYFPLSICASLILFYLYLYLSH